MNIILSIFFTFIKIGAFSFGGGLAMLPFIEKEVVQNHQWIFKNEFIDIIAIAEMTPGPIAVNTSTFVGYKVGGFLGALAGSMGVVIVSFILATLLAKYFIKVKDAKGTKAVFKGIRPAVIGLVLCAAISVGKTSLTDLKSIGIALLIFFMITKLKIHPIISIILAGFLGFIFY